MYSVPAPYPTPTTLNQTKKQGSWFFHPWNPWEVTDPATGQKVAFDHAKPDLLATDPRCWILDPADKWHGACCVVFYCVGVACEPRAESRSLSPQGFNSCLLSTHTRTTTHKPTKGFTGLAPGWCMLDPIKVAIVSPGMAPDGTLLVRFRFCAVYVCG